MELVSESFPKRYETYWTWLTVGLFLHVPVDLLTTIGAVARFGIGVEANPLVAALFAGPLWLLVGVHIAVVFGVVYGFDAVLTSVDRTSPRLRPAFKRLIEAWLAVVVVAGLALFVNNMRVVLHGVSLF